MRDSLTSLDSALAAVLARARLLVGSEQVSTFDADGRVLLAQVVSPLRVPPHDNSAMDGYALRSSDVLAPGALLPVSQRIAAGQMGKLLTPATVARIFTGAPLPEGADAVVMQEDCEVQSDGQVQVNCQPTAGQWVRRAGGDIALNAVVLEAGTRLTPAELGLAASIGLAQLEVARRPRVALFSTGDELVMPGSVRPEDMPPGAIYNSNRFFLRAMLKRLGCEVTDLGIVPDQREATLAALREAARAHDLILTSGGVSVGEEDHIKPALEQLGQLDLWKIAIKPGKPFAYGCLGPLGATHFMGLPGNPVSSFVTFLLLVRPFLLRLQGVTDVAPRVVAATAAFDWPRGDRRREFLRVRYNEDGQLELFRNQTSNLLTSAAWGDGLVDNPPENTIARGDTVRFLSFAQLLS